jgi:hypothetical protein
MKTLVIHPHDASTDFLSPIYAGLDNVTLVTDSWSQNQIQEAIQTHDQVMMMGHGSPSGLFSVGQFPTNNPFASYVIGTNMVEALSQKDNNIFIWCNADQFVTRHRLKGFYTGMFISETGEAAYCGLPGTPQYIVDESNHGFVNILREKLQDTRDTNLLFEQTSGTYSIIADINPVAKYNYNRLFCR